MKFRKNLTSALIASALTAMSFVASAVTLRVANQDDALALEICQAQ